MVNSLGLCGMVPSSSAIVLGNMVGKVNEDVCNRKLATHRIRTWAPGWKPAVITTDWEPAEWESPDGKPQLN